MPRQGQRPGQELRTRRSSLVHVPHHAKADAAAAIAVIEAIAVRRVDVPRRTEPQSAAQLASAPPPPPAPRPARGCGGVVIIQTILTPPKNFPKKIVQPECFGSARFVG